MNCNCIGQLHFSVQIKQVWTCCAHLDGLISVEHGSGVLRHIGCAEPDVELTGYYASDTQPSLDAAAVCQHCVLRVLKLLLISPCTTLHQTLPPARMQACFGRSTQGSTCLLCPAWRRQLAPMRSLEDCVAGAHGLRRLCDAAPQQVLCVIVLAHDRLQITRRLRLLRICVCIQAASNYIWTLREIA